MQSVLCIYVFVYLCIYVFVYLYLYICVFVFVYLCICVLLSYLWVIRVSVLAEGLTLSQLGLDHAVCFVPQRGKHQRSATILWWNRNLSSFNYLVIKVIRVICHHSVFVPQRGKHQRSATIFWWNRNVSLLSIIWLYGRQSYQGHLPSLMTHQRWTICHHSVFCQRGQN